MDDAMIRVICQAQQSGAQVALVSVIATRGSTPRKAGARMLIFPDGRAFGTIGGGCAEAEVRLQALTALDDNRSFTVEVFMSGEAAADEGMACGGTMQVFIQVV